MVESRLKMAKKSTEVRFELTHALHSGCFRYYGLVIHLLNHSDLDKIGVTGEPQS